MIFRHLPSTFCSIVGPSVNFCQLSMQPRDLLSTSVKYPCGHETFWQFPSTLDVAKRPSFHFHQLSALLRDLLSAYVNFPCSQKTFCQLPPTSVQQGELSSTSVNFCAAGRPSIDFRQYLVRPGDLPLNFINSLCSWVTFC